MGKLHMVAEIDQLIMDLTYIKNGQPASLEKLRAGLGTLESIISYSDQPNGQNIKKKLGKIPYFERQYPYSDPNNPIGPTEDMLQVRKDIEELIDNLTVSDRNRIEKIQESLLRISTPIWNQELEDLWPNK